MKETPASISVWALEAFGEAGSIPRIAARANEEMAELIRVTTSNGTIGEIAEECADIVIVLARLAHTVGYNIFDEVDRKMAKNRKRTWKRDGTGHGYHSGEDAHHIDEAKQPIEYVCECPKPKIGKLAAKTCDHWHGIVIDIYQETYECEHCGHLQMCHLKLLKAVRELKS